MVRGLVLRSLLFALAREESNGSGGRKPSCIPRRLLAPPDQSIACCPPKQPAAGIPVHGLWFQSCKGVGHSLSPLGEGGAKRRVRVELRQNLRGARDIALAGADGMASSCAHLDRMK